MESWGAKMTVGLFIALAIGIVAYAFASIDRMNVRMLSWEQEQRELSGTIRVLEAKNQERAIRIEERIASLRREIMARCDRLDKMLLAN